jgi:hypothetical protein
MELQSNVVKIKDLSRDWRKVASASSAGDGLRTLFVAVRHG